MTVNRMLYVINIFTIIFVINVSYFTVNGHKDVHRHTNNRLLLPNVTIVNSSLSDHFNSNSNSSAPSLTVGNVVPLRRLINLNSNSSIELLGRSKREETEETITVKSDDDGDEEVETQKPTVSEKPLIESDDNSTSTEIDSGKSEVSSSTSSPESPDIEDSTSTSTSKKLNTEDDDEDESSSTSEAPDTGSDESHSSSTTETPDAEEDDKDESSSTSDSESANENDDSESSSDISKPTSISETDIIVKPSRTLTKVVDEDDDEEEDDDEDDEDDEDDGDVCDYSFSTIIRSLNTSGLFPDDYQELSEKVFKTNIHQKVDNFSQTLQVVDRLVEYAHKLHDNRDLQSTIQYLGSVVSDRMFEARLESQCAADLLMILNSVRRLEYWALKFPDSWGNLIPSGLLSGVASSFGEFDQCLSIKSPAVNTAGRHIYGRYCHLQFKPPIPDYVNYKPEWEEMLLKHPTYKFMVDKMTDFTKRIVVDNKTPLAKYLVEMFAYTGQALLNYGICIPQSCSTAEIEGLINSMIYPITKTPITINPELCTDHPEVDERKLNGFQYFSIILLSTLTILTITSTIYHYYLLNIDDQESDCEDETDKIKKANYSTDTEEVDYLEVQGAKTANKKVNENCLAQNLSSVNIGTNGFKSNSDVSDSSKSTDKTLLKNKMENQSQDTNILLSFSLISNWQNLFNHTSNPNRNPVLDTLRVVFIFLLFFLQSYFYTVFQYSTFRNLGTEFPYSILEKSRYFPGHMPNLWFDGIMFLMCVTLMIKQFPNFDSKNFSYVIFVGKRWLRLSTALLGSITLLYLYPLTGSGPIFYQNEQYLTYPCKEWSSLMSGFLYYSNWNPTLMDYKLENHLSICNFSSWILSVSTQLYISIGAIGIVLYRRPKLGLIIIGVLLAVSPLLITFPYWALGHTSFMAVQDTPGSSPKDYYRKLFNYHMNTVQYVTSSCIGLLTGWLIVKKPNLQIPGGRRGEKWLWWLTFSTPFILHLWNDTFFQLEEKISDWNLLTWFVVSKFTWPMALGYLVYMTQTGRARKIKRIFTFSIFRPLAKFALCIYLVRIVLIWHRNTTVRYTHTYYFSVAYQNILFDFLFSTFYGLILHLLFEAPTIAITKYFDKRNKSRDMGDQNSNPIVNGEKKLETFTEIDLEKVDTLR